MDYPQIPGYNIEAEIGKGGMGVVYRARHLALDRVVALKVIHPRFTSDPQFVKSFETEARIIAKLSHPNIVSVYDFGHYEGIYYLSMQYVLGQTVRDLLAVRRPKLEELASIVRQVGDALDYAHRSQVVHRDIKTNNILLCPDGKAMIIDFGIAQGNYADSANSVWAGAGTRSYMSPEQLKGYPASPRSDQYSLGVAVYEMLAGRLPFGEQDPEAIARQHISATPPPLSRGRTDITPRMETAVMRALSKLPEMRFPTVGDFAREIEAACREAEVMDTIALAPIAASVAPLAATASMRAAPLTMPAAVPAAARQGGNGWVYATRGGQVERGRSPLAWIAAILLVLGLGAAGYFAYARQMTQTPATAKVASKQANEPSSLTTKHRKSTRPRRRPHESSAASVERASQTANGESTGAAATTGEPETSTKDADDGTDDRPAVDVGPDPKDHADAPSGGKDEASG